jgi:hypothetical protein
LADGGNADVTEETDGSTTSTRLGAGEPRRGVGAGVDVGVGVGVGVGVHAWATAAATSTASATLMRNTCAVGGFERPSCDDLLPGNRALVA